MSIGSGGVRPLAVHSPSDAIIRRAARLRIGSASPHSVSYRARLSSFECLHSTKTTSVRVRLVGGLNSSLVREGGQRTSNKYHSFYNKDIQTRVGACASRNGKFAFFSAFIAAHLLTLGAFASMLRSESGRDPQSHFLSSQGLAHYLGRAEGGDLSSAVLVRSGLWSDFSASAPDCMGGMDNHCLSTQAARASFLDFPCGGDRRRYDDR